MALSFVSNNAIIVYCRTIENRLQNRFVNYLFQSSSITVAKKRRNVVWISRELFFISIRMAYFNCWWTEKVITILMVDWTPIEFLDGNDGSGLELGERDRAVATSPINNVFEEKNGRGGHRSPISLPTKLCRLIGSRSRSLIGRRWDSPAACGIERRIGALHPSDNFRDGISPSRYPIVRRRLASTFTFPISPAPRNRRGKAPRFASLLGFSILYRVFYFDGQKVGSRHYQRKTNASPSISSASAITYLQRIDIGVDSQVVSHN